MTRPLRVLQVVQRYYPELGGLETHVAEVTRRLAARDDLDITVLTTDRTGRLPREAEVNGVPVIRRRSWPEHGEAYFSPGLVRVIRDGNWDLVHVQGSQTTVPTVAMIAARAFGIPYVVTFHSGGHSSARHAPITRLQNVVNRPLFARAAALIAVSRFERARFERITRLPSRRFTVIANGGALPAVPAGVVPRPGSIVTSGRLERYKGHHRVIAALPIVQRHIPEAHVTVLGSGPYEHELRRLAVELGVEDSVQFRHLLPTERAEMANILASASVMAALSEYEAHPVAVMEAVALGLPVVGADVAGIGDLVEDGWVVGVEADADPDEVARTLTQQLEAVAGQPHRPPEFDLPTWESSADALADVYRSASRRTGEHRRRVVQIITTLTTGGAERQLESVVQHSRHQQRTIALYGGGPVAESMESAGHDVEVLRLAGIRRALALPVLVLRLLRLRPDVVQVHLLSGQLWGLPAARLARVPLVISTEHSLMSDSIENRPLSPGLRALYLALNRMADRTVAVSRETADRLVRWGVRRRRITVIDNGIDFARLAVPPSTRSRTRDALGVAEGVQLIGAVGRLEEVKRFPQLVAALAPTLAAGQRELLVVGDGPLRSALEQCASELGVSQLVRLVGARSDVPELLAAMDVLVSPSRDETFGMAVVEGLGAGLPVVHGACPALDALPNGLLQALPIDEGDGRDEADQIRTQVDRALTIGRSSAPADLIAAYDIRMTTARLDDLYEVESGRVDGASRVRRR